MWNLFKGVSGLWSRRGDMRGLELVIGILILVFGFVVGVICTAKFYNRKKAKEQFKHYQKYLFDVCREENQKASIKLDGYFIRKGYKNVVVYGMGMYCEEFINNISVGLFHNLYYADTNIRSLGRAKVYSLEELKNQDFYDVIVITSYNHASEIEKQLQSIGISRDIISYRDLIINAPRER